MQNPNETLSKAISGDIEAQQLFESDEFFNETFDDFNEEKYFDDRERYLDVKETLSRGNWY